MASQRQIEANRLNARKSTGPKSEAGKARSRMNARKHGLSARLPSLPPPDPQVPPLARAIAGEGITDPAALALAEEIAAHSVTLISIRSMRAELIAQAEAMGPGAAQASSTVGANAVRALSGLERYERQALTRRSRALTGLDTILSRPPKDVIHDN